LIARVSGNAGTDADAEPLEQRLYHPELARKVELAEDIDVGQADIVGFHGADDMVEQRFACELVAEVLGADEAGRVDRHYRQAEFLRRMPANRFDVVADQRGDTG